ncbi:MAG TPA: phosphoribosylformylglycinamidine synthase subunit PurS [Thermoplasmataceae archaeon]|nr:phosphoribosylformylglycinamidine synthase subunit PurS [Thermoplasmataceae archaeon]
MVMVKVTVNYLEGVEDPEAITILKNLSDLGYRDVEGLKISKVYELKIKGSKQKAMKVAKEISETILTNPVIQEYDMSD